MDILAVARELEALAQTGLHFAEDRFDRERYGRLRVIAAELRAAQSNLTVEEILDWRRDTFGYATPKVDVRGVVMRDDRVLLVRENLDAGRWTLPGGWADVNESPGEAVAREVEEESGYVVEPAVLLAVLDREKQGHTPPYPHHVYKLFFHCRITGGAPRATPESSESAFFPADELPELSRSRVLAAQIQRCCEAVRAGRGAVWFD